MITTCVFFDFETKEQWIMFGEKFLIRKEFLKHTPLLVILKERNETFIEFVEYSYKRYSGCLISCVLGITTKSEKTLRKLSEFIKENHYENNYRLTDDWGNKLCMDLDGLFK